MYHYKLIYYYNKYGVIIIITKTLNIFSMKEAKKLSESRIQKIL